MLLVRPFGKFGFSTSLRVEFPKMTVLATFRCLFDLFSNIILVFSSILSFRTSKWMTTCCQSRLFTRFLRWTWNETCFSRCSLFSGFFGFWRLSRGWFLSFFRAAAQCKVHGAKHSLWNACSTALREVRIFNESESRAFKNYNFSNF